MIRHYLTFLGFFFSIFIFGQTTKTALFLGNSYTSVNNLPELVAEMANADGNTFIHDKNTPGGYTLEGHSTNATSLEKIAADEWDFVILQEQSQRPSFPWEQVEEEVFPYAELLVYYIRDANECAIPMFYNTWGRRDGDDQWDSINTFVKMNQRLQHAYDFMGNKNSGIVSPVGVGFSHVYQDDDAPLTHEELYAGDGSHPSIYGSFLAACMFYELIFEEDVADNTFLPDAMDIEKGTYLRTLAHHVLTEVDSVETDYTQPIANYEVIFDGLTASFTNLSEHAFTYFWDFGDGNTSTEENPVHIYADDSEYTITFTAYYCDKSSTINEPGTASIFSESKSRFKVFPNPSTTGHFALNLLENQRTPITIYSADGKLVKTLSLEGDKTITFSLERGIYFVKYEGMVETIIHQ